MLRRHAGPLRAIVKAGDVATDGSRVTEIEGLSSVRRHVAFDARTEAIVRIPIDGAPEVLARAGDPLPAPLAGHFHGDPAAGYGVSTCPVRLAQRSRPARSSPRHLSSSGTR
jgi:hypothetical protein